MKLLYVITKSNWGGAQKYVFDLATAMRANGHDVAVVLGGDGILSQKLRTRDIKVMNLKNLKRDISAFKEFSVLIDLVKIFKKEEPDIIHLNSSKIGGLGALAGRLAGVPKIVFTAHGFAFNEDRPMIVKLILFVLTYLTILLSHTTIVINQRELEQIKNLPFIKNRLALIYIGIHEPQTTIISKKSSAKNIPISIGTISELTKNKGLTFAIEAIARMKNRNITFSIIGDGEERRSLERLIAAKGVKGKVHLLGFKDNASDYLHSFDIFTLTSVKEGLPYTILEAGIAGLPVVASNVGGIGEIIESGTSGILVPPKNVMRIVEALNLLIDSPNKRSELGENLRKTVLEKFSFTTMLTQTQKIYAD